LESSLWKELFESLTEEEKEFLKKMGHSKTRKVRAPPSKGLEWKDLPPVFSGELLREILISYPPNGISEQTAKVGDYYWHHERKVRALKLETEEEVTLPETWVLYEVILPEPEKYKERNERIHKKYLNTYRNYLNQLNPMNRKIARKLFLGSLTEKTWPEVPFPNGKYETERWKPKVFSNGRWLPASPKDIRNWKNIPKERKRVDFKKGIIPDLPHEREGIFENTGYEWTSRLVLKDFGEGPILVREYKKLRKF